jgi:hypothetical protein
VSALSLSLDDSDKIDQLQTRFAEILPRIQAYAARFFAYVRCPQRRDDYAAEAITICWKWFCRLTNQGKDATAFVSVLTGFAVRAVKCGRRLAGQEPAKDVFSCVAPRPCFIHTRETAGYPYSVVQPLEGAQLARESSQPALAFAGWLTRESGEKLLGLSGRTVDGALKEADTKGFKAYALGLNLKGNIASSVTKIVSNNVAGIAEGSDPT